MPPLNTNDISELEDSHCFLWVLILKVSVKLSTVEVTRRALWERRPQPRPPQALKKSQKPIKICYLTSWARSEITTSQVLMYYSNSFYMQPIIYNIPQPPCEFDTLQSTLTLITHLNSLGSLSGIRTMDFCSVTVHRFSAISETHKSLLPNRVSHKRNRC